MAKIGRQNKEIGKIIDTSKIVNELQSDIKEMFDSVSVSDLIKKEDLDKITQRFEKIEEAIKHLSKQKLNVSTFEDYRKEIEACQKSASEFFETIKKGSSTGVNQKFKDAISSLEKFKVPEYEVPDFSVPADEIKKEAETAKEAVSKVAEEVSKDTSKVAESVKEEAAKVTEEVSREISEVEKLQKAFEKAQDAFTKAEQDKETGLKNLEKIKSWNPNVQYEQMSSYFEKMSKLSSKSEKYKNAFRLLKNIWAGSDILATDLFQQKYDLSSINLYGEQRSKKEKSMLDHLYGEEGYKKELEDNVKKAKRNITKAQKELKEAIKEEKNASKSVVAEQVSKENKNDFEKETVKAKVEAEPEVTDDFQEKVQEEVDKKKVTAKVSVEEADDSKKEDKKSKKNKKSVETQENQTDNSNSEKSDEKEPEGKATLEPKLSDTFKEDAEKLIDELGIESSVTLSPTLAEDFNDKVTDLIGESKKKDATSTEETTVEVDSEESTQDKVNSTTKLKPELIDTFKEDAEAKVEQLDIESPVTLYPHVPDDFKDEAMNNLPDLTLPVELTLKENENENEDNKSEESSNQVELKPKLADTFSEDVRQLVDELNPKADITLEPSLVTDFSDRAQERVDDWGISVYVDLVPRVNEGFNTDAQNAVNKESEQNADTVELKPRLSDNFKQNAEDEVNKLGIEGRAILLPVLSSDFNELAMNRVNDANPFASIDLYPNLSANFENEAKEKVSDLKIKVPVNLELKKGKRSLASTTKAIEETLGNEFSSFDKISASIENVTTKIGEKNKAIQEEGGIVDRVSANEVTRFMSIRENIQRLINSIETLIKLNPYVEQLQSIGSSFNSMQINPDFVAGLKGIVSQLDKLGTKLESFGKKDINFDNLKTLSTIIPKLKISEKSVKAIDSLQDSLVDLSGVLRELQQADGGSYKFLDQLSNLVAKSKELEHLAKIISNYEKVTNLTGEASPKQQIKDQYSAYINNLKEIIRLKKEVGNTDDSSRIKLLNNEIRSLSAKNQWIKKNIAAMLQENPELETATKNEQNTVGVLQKKLETQKEINKLNKADRQAANAESSDKNALTGYYKQLKDNLTEIRKLTSSLGRANDEEGQSIIQDQIDAYNEENEKINSSIEAIYKRNSALQSSMTVEQNKIDILNDEIATTQKLNEENRKQRELAAQEALDKRTTNQEVTEAAIREDSEGWKRALSVLQDNDYFKEARNGASSYLDLLYDIQSITAQIRRDERTGDEYVSYKFTDSLGSSLTVGADGQLLIQKSAVLDLKKAYTELISLKNNFDNISLKASKDEISTKQLKILQEYKDLLEQVGNEYRTIGWEEGSSWDKDAILAELDSGKIEKIIKSLQNLKSEYNALTVYEKGTSDTKIEKFLNKIYTFMGNNTKAAKLFRTELESLIGTAKAAGKDVNLDNLMDQFLKIENAAASSGMMGSSFLDDFKKQANYTLSNFLAQYLSIRDVIRYAQSAISTIEGLDYALLDLSKTAAMTESQLNDFYFSANDSAKALGVTTEEIIDLASSWSRLGYNTNEEATKMAEMTAKFAAISPGTSTDEAQTG